eukprot:scaffold1334_cov123-Cylindrotheca_fusiformis.AAC.6
MDNAAFWLQPSDKCGMFMMESLWTWSLHALPNSVKKEEIMKFFTQLPTLGLGLLSVVHAQENTTSLFGGSENDGYLSWLENESGGQLYEKSIFLPGASGSEDDQGVAFIGRFSPRRRKEKWIPLTWPL